ncbi:unnamed protein product [Penicillium palitans]
MQNPTPILPAEILLLIARQLGPLDLIHLARAIPGMDRDYKPKYWTIAKDEAASVNGWDDIIESLLTKNFDFSIQNSRGYTALHYACESDQYKTASLLLDAGLSPNILAKNGMAALHSAIAKGNTSIVRLLLENGADISVITTGGYSMLHWAMQTQKIDIIDLLVINGADFTKGDISGRTPLHWAAADGNMQAVELLLRAGADATSIDHDGYTPADLANQHELSVARRIESVRQRRSPSLAIHALCSVIRWVSAWV